jgi:hypothetical protein
LDGNALGTLPGQREGPRFPFLLIGKQDERADGAILTVDAGLRQELRREPLVACEAGAAEGEDRALLLGFSRWGEHTGCGPGGLLARSAALDHRNAHAFPGERPRERASDHSSADDRHVKVPHPGSIISRGGRQESGASSVSDKQLFPLQKGFEKIDYFRYLTIIAWQRPEASENVSRRLLKNCFARSS